MDTTQGKVSKLIEQEKIHIQQRSKVRQGIENRQRILETVKSFPVVTASLIAYGTGIELKTVQNQLTRLAQDKVILAQSRGLGEEYLYRWKGLKPIKQQAQPHMLARAESWAALQKGVPAEWVVEEGVLKEFVTSAGTVIPDLVFVLRNGETGKRSYFAWEEDLNSMRRKDECLSKYEGMWWWRKEFCFDTEGVNRWGIAGIIVLTNATDDRRMQELRETARAAHPQGKISKMFLFTSREKWNMHEPGKLYEDIWVNVKDDTPRCFWK